MTRRNATIALHWTVVFLVLIQLKGGTDAVAVRWVFAISGLAMCLVAVTKGLMGRPGPKLQGVLRRLYRPGHAVLYALIGWASLATIAELSAFDFPGPAAYTVILILFAAGIVHSLFHLWRHMALYDNALRMITPKFLHGVL